MQFASANSRPLPPMSSVRPRHLRTLGVIAGVAALLLPTGCHKKPAAPAAAAEVAPEPFTAQLPEVAGVQAIVSLRHPKLVNQDLEKLMKGIPEAAMLRAMLTQFAAYGYPEFSEIAADSNLGAAILSVSGADLKAKTSVPIGFAKLKEGGKLWTLLSQSQVVMQKHGDWVLFAKDQASLDKLTSADSVIAYLEKPQSEDIRFWGRSSPDFLSGLKELIVAAIKEQATTLTPEEQKAALAYLDALYTLVAELHSADFSLTFADDGVKIAYSAQFLPETPGGIYLRHKVGPSPAVAQYVSSDALATMIVRQNPQATFDLANAMFDVLIAVDYPPVAHLLTELKTNYDTFIAASDGGGVATFNLGFGPMNGRDRVVPEFFYVLSGNFTPEIARNYFKNSQALANQFTKFALAQMKTPPGQAVTSTSQPYAENALTIDGASFDSFTMATAMNGKEISSTTEYLGVVGGNLVMADSEATLKKHLAGLEAKTALADGIHLPEVPNEIAGMAANGGKLVDLLMSVAKLDLTDADTQAQVNHLKASYVAAGPIVGVATADQAKATFTLSIPYKFIETSIQLGQYLSARKVNLLALILPSAAPTTTPSAPGGP